jgi:hypothetical protein
MRRTSFLGGAFIAALFISASTPAHAFPNPPASANPFWIPILRTNAITQDPVNASANYSDVVGDSTHPAAYLSSDATNLYLRVRVNGAPATTGGIGCMLDTDGTLTTYEYLAIYDFTGAPTIRYLKNTVTTTPNTANETAETAVTTFTPATNAVISTADSTFSSNADSFVDLAIPWTTVRQTGITSATQLRFVCGATTTTANLAADIFDGGTGLALSTSWSDAYTCNNGAITGCVTANDSDGDGVSDAQETTFGTNKNSIDSDGDGIPDYFELTIGTDPTIQAVNSDGQGAIDALDLDSDNDCTPDSADGLSGFRVPSIPNANASLACAGSAATTPTCDKTVGACAACNGDLGQPVTRACYDATKQYCAPNGGCGICDSSHTSACTPAAPACESTTKSCTPCNGDHGTGATATCPSASLPACNAGACVQCSPTLLQNCPPQTPSCDATGACAQCTADNGGTGAACPSAAAPACNATGGFKGRCTICSPSNTSLCTGTKPTCDPSSGMCAACTSDHNSAGVFACPTAAAPTCALSGANKGQCAKCATNADCGAGHLGTACDPVSGTCITGDIDGDGIPDDVEAILGTDPTKADTDGDGIDDKTEVTPQGGGSFTKVDTDDDGTIDALDLDSDGDGLLDADESGLGDGGTLLDTDGDGIPNFRDTDDDGDAIDTIVEISDTKAAHVSNDVDGDGKVNWYDSDANANGKLDGVDGREDADGDGIPNYLDLVFALPVPDAGPADAGGSSSSSSSSSTSSGFVSTPIPPDAAPPVPIPPDDGVLEGSGCSTTGGAFSSFAALWLAIMGIGLARRRRK